MKTSIVIFSIAFLSITTFAQKNSIDKDIKMYTQVWDDIVNKGKTDLINETHFDTNIIMVTSPENIVGIDAFKAYYQNFITGFSERTFTVKNIFGQGNQLVKHWHFTGKHTGDFFGIPATGNTVNIEGVTIAKMKNGKIAQEQDFLDNTLMMQQLGLVSNPENVGIIDSAYNNFSKGDVPAVLGLMDTNIIWYEAESNSLADGNPYKGPDAVLNGVFLRLGDKYEYFKLKDIELHDMSNNQVLATLRYDAKMKTTGETIDVQVAHLWTLKNGKIIGFQQYADTKKLADSEKM